MKQKVDVMWSMNRYAECLQYVAESVKDGRANEALLLDIKNRYQVMHGLAYDAPERQQLHLFEAWLHSNGAIYSKLFIRQQSVYSREVHAMKLINKDEVLLSVPLGLIITSKMGQDTPFGSLIKKSVVRLSWDYLTYITTFMMTQQHDPSSTWKPYMDVYPKRAESFPVFYTEDEKKLLQGSPMTDHIVTELAEMKTEYDRIVSAVPGFKVFSFDDYARNKMIVTSRIFMVSTVSEKERIMVPFADFFNHHNDKVGQTYWNYDGGTKCFRITAKAPIQPADPVSGSWRSMRRYVLTSERSRTTASCSIMVSWWTTIRRTLSTSSYSLIWTTQRCPQKSGCSVAPQRPTLNSASIISTSMKTKSTTTTS